MLNMFTLFKNQMNVHVCKLNHAMYILWHKSYPIFPFFCPSINFKGLVTMLMIHMAMINCILTFILVL